MKKFLEKFKRKKKAVLKEVKNHEDWLGAEASVEIPKEDKKKLKQRSRKR